MTIPGRTDAGQPHHPYGDGADQSLEEQVGPDQLARLRQLAPDLSEPLIRQLLSSDDG